jgi:DNA repair photolyase
MLPNVTKIHAQSILRKQKKAESWFVSRYGMNLYCGCSHNCAYCDGRAEKYQVEGEFGHDIALKMNAIDVLKRELDPTHKRKPMKRGFIFVGGGVCDSYQSVELQYELTRRARQLIAQYNLPVHILGKRPQQRGRKSAKELSVK